MSLEKQVEIDKIEIIGNKFVQVRQATKVFEDGNQLSVSYHRWLFNPGDDYSFMPDNVKAICDMVHTPEVVEMFQREVAAAQELE
jgi:hypothetical protein